MIHPTPTPPSNTPCGSGMIGALSCSQRSELCRAFGNISTSDLNNGVPGMFSQGNDMYQKRRRFF
ncbi:hypothetical protein DPMN_183423 [Dreissena polymorpha]|uniref:Uncharacterized protein n=1 Tax=Dreissena polymorpha TaxID=45954 RepID=A0A9D4DGL1_DREPO|nr:hypothetical protein DPMN_183423 [Dreissena polymorpha]